MKKRRNGVLSVISEVSNGSIPKTFHQYPLSDIVIIINVGCAAARFLYFNRNGHCLIFLRLMRLMFRLPNELLDLLISHLAR